MVLSVTALLEGICGVSHAQTLLELCHGESWLEWAKTEPE